MWCFQVGKLWPKLVTLRCLLWMWAKFGLEWILWTYHGLSWRNNPACISLSLSNLKSMYFWSNFKMELWISRTLSIGVVFNLEKTPRFLTWLLGLISISFWYICWVSLTWWKVVTFRDCFSISGTPPTKKTNVPQKGATSKGTPCLPQSHYFSGDMLVFGSVVVRQGEFILLRPLKFNMVHLKISPVSKGDEPNLVSQPIIFRWTIRQTKGLLSIIVP